MRVAIIGAGAMGCLFAARLRLSGNEVLLVHDNPGIVSRIRKRGVRLRELDGRNRSVRVPIALGPADLRDFDLVLFAVKAYSTEKAASLHRRGISARATILTLQNGLGNVELLSRSFGVSRIVAGSTTEGSLLLGPGVIAHTGKGSTVIGELDGSRSQRCASIVRLLRRAGFQVSITRNVKGVTWCKTIVNAAINPVSALTRLRNGELADEGLKETLLAVLEEGVKVSRAEGVRLEPRDPARVLFGVLRATSRNESSMLQDVLNGRRTEIRELNGKIVERGRKLRIPTPFNRLLTYLVLGLERGSAAKSLY